MNGFLRNLPHYECNKRVQALEIAHTIPNPRGVELHFVDKRFAPFQVDAIWFDNHKVEAGGYLVFSESGIPSFMPGVAFRQTFLPVGDNA